MIKPTKSQIKYIDEISNMMKLEIDIVVCGAENIGKSSCISLSAKKVGIILIKIDESITLQQLKSYTSTCVIGRNKIYYHLDESIVKNPHIKKMIENRIRKTPLIFEVKSKYGIPTVISKMARMTMYYPRPEEIKAWFREVYRKDLKLSLIQNFKSIGELIKHIIYNSDIPENKLPTNKVIGAIIKSTDIRTRLKHIIYLQENVNIKYILKVILFNTRKFYSNYARYNAIKILSFCDSEKSLFPLLILPKIENKKISREVSYPKEMKSGV